jgi:hypothetical protein
MEPAISIEELKKIKKIDGVSVFTCGDLVARRDVDGWVAKLAHCKSEPYYKNKMCWGEWRRVVDGYRDWWVLCDVFKWEPPTETFDNQYVVVPGDLFFRFRFADWIGRSMGECELGRLFSFLMSKPVVIDKISLISNMDELVENAKKDIGNVERYLAQAFFLGKRGRSS